MRVIVTSLKEATNNVLQKFWGEYELRTKKLTLPQRLLIRAQGVKLVKQQDNPCTLITYLTTNKAKNPNFVDVIKTRIINDLEEEGLVRDEDYTLEVKNE